MALVRRSSDDDHYHVEAVHVRLACPSLMHFRRADSFRRQQPPPSKPRLEVNRDMVENSMTLKQACSSEYQGAQGAFKDSMIH